MPEMKDLHGRPLQEGSLARLSGGYADRAVPVRLMHEQVTVTGFGRTRVEVQLLNPEYADRPRLRVLPRSLVVE